jgi:hypothetical protein
LQPGVWHGEQDAALEISLICTFARFCPDEMPVFVAVPLAVATVFGKPLKLLHDEPLFRLY